MQSYPHKMVISLTFLMIIFVIMPGGCIGSNNTSNSSTNKYIVINEVKQVNAKVVEGQLYNFTSPMMFMNDATPEPVYPDQPGKYNVNVNSSLKMLYFGYYSLYGPYRNITSVRGIYSYPYQLDSGVIILGSDQNGTVLMSYNNESINLDLGKDWSSPITSTNIENTTGYNGSLVKIEYDTNWWIYSEPNLYNK